MKKIYLIEKLLHVNGKLIGYNAEYEVFGYVTSKAKADDTIKNGRPIEKLDMFGKSFIPKQVVNEYRIKEVTLIQ
jgi:hypothetical protein